MSLFTIYCFFFKQKTAYEMRISDWSSDVCSSDLAEQRVGGSGACALPRSVEAIPLCRSCGSRKLFLGESAGLRSQPSLRLLRRPPARPCRKPEPRDRTSVV